MFSGSSNERKQAGGSRLLGRLSDGWKGAKGKAQQAGDSSAKYAKMAAEGAAECASKGAGAVKAGAKASASAMSNAAEEAAEMGGAAANVVRTGTSSLMGRPRRETQRSRFANLFLDRAQVDSGAYKSAGFGLTNPFASAYRAAKREGQTRLLDMGAYGRAKVMFGLGCAIKSNATSDPDMCQCMKNRIVDLIDVFWSDLTIYNEQMYEDRRNAIRDGASTSDDLGDIGVPPCCLSPCWFRAKILYHLRPYNKSVFGQMKDPFWWVLTILALLPMRGIRISFFAFMLFLTICSPPPDKFQLVKFIIGLKGSQFISSGMIQAWIAAVKYYLCVHPGGMHTCATDGPGASQNVVTGLMDLFGSTLLSWLAFLFLPCSVRSAGLRTIAEDDEGDDENKAARRHGGRRRLAALLVYDMICFTLACCFGMWLMVNGAPTLAELKAGMKASEGLQELTGGQLEAAGLQTSNPLLDQLKAAGMKAGQELEESHSAGIALEFAEIQSHAGTWEGRSAIFWARVLYAFTSWPFVILLVPGLSTILTHTRQTGYNKQGVCVPFMLRKVKQEEDDD